MDSNENSNYSKSIEERISFIINKSGLTIAGLAELTGISESHLYALQNGNKSLTGEAAEKLGKPFKLQGWQILRLDLDLQKIFRETSELAAFKKEFSGNSEYFKDENNNTKPSHYIEFEFLTNKVFNSPAYLWEIIEVLKSIGKTYSSKELSQILHYLVKKGKLASEKRLIKLRSDKLGDREVDVFYNKPS